MNGHPHGADARRGVTIGLWILAGLAFLLDVLFSRSSGGEMLGPGILALAAAWTALLAPTASGQRTGASRPILHVLLGTVLALGTAFAVIHEGDRRSLLYVALVTVFAVALGYDTHRRTKVRFPRLHA